MICTFHVWFRWPKGWCLLIWLMVRLFFFDYIYLLVSEIEYILLFLSWLWDISLPDKLMLIVFGNLFNHFNLINIIDIKILRGTSLAPKINLRPFVLGSLLQRILLQLIKFELLSDLVKIRRLDNFSEITFFVINQLNLIKRCLVLFLVWWRQRFKFSFLILSLNLIYLLTWSWSRTHRSLEGTLW